MLCAALLCALVSGLGGGAGEGRKVLSGLFLALVILGRFGALDKDDLVPEFSRAAADAEAVVAEGEAQAERMKFSLITRSCEAYILDKAAELGASVTVSVTLSPESGLPDSAAITGQLTPLQRQRLAGEITQALGIEKEALVWNP